MHKHKETLIILEKKYLVWEFFYMVILDKKRIATLTSLIVVSTFVFVFQTAQNEKTVETVALPVTNKVIVLDAGHRRARPVEL